MYNPRVEELHYFSVFNRMFVIITEMLCYDTCSLPLPVKNAFMHCLLGTVILMLVKVTAVFTVLVFFCILFVCTVVAIDSCS